MEADLLNLNAAQQVVVLRSLRQIVAAFMLGLSPRSMRNHHEIPRCANGRYDARELLRFRSAVASSKHPDKITKDLKLALDMQDASAY